MRLLSPSDNGRELNLSSFGNIAPPRPALSLAAVMCTHICANEGREKRPAAGVGFISFPGL